MYSGQIYYNDKPITVEQAIALKLVYRDENGDIWFTQDTLKLIQLKRDLHLTGDLQPA